MKTTTGLPLRLITAVLIIMAPCVSIFACTCEPKPPPCYEFGRRDAVFIGRVTEIARDEWNRSKIALSVEKAYKGVSTSTASTATIGTSCDFETFRVDGRYLIYGKKYQSDGQNYFAT